MVVKIIIWSRRYMNENELKELREMVEKYMVFILVRKKEVENIPLPIRNRAIIVTI